MGQATYTNNPMFFFMIFWTKLFWSRSQKLLDVGTGGGDGAKKLRRSKLEPETEI